MNTSYIKENLPRLMAISSPTGYTKNAADFIFNELKKFGYLPEYTNKGGVICNLSDSNTDNRSNSNSLLISAHIDTLGGMVAEVKSNGRLRLTKIGGLMANNTETENVTVIARDGKEFSGTFQLMNASVHVNPEYAKTERSFDNMEVLLDYDVKTKEDVDKFNIDTGCYVCFDPRTIITSEGYIKSRFLDDKLSAIILLDIAKHIKDDKISLKRDIYLHFTVYEEVGHGGCASIPVSVNEMLCVDMGCVGEGLSCNERQVSICVKDSGGPYDYSMVTKLITLAKENKIDFATDVYPFYGSDADAALSAGHDIKHSLIGAGVYASHGYERSHLDGVSNTFNLILAYIKD